MRLYDRLTIDASNRTSAGYLVVNAKVAKLDNVQTYLGSEVGKPELATVRVFRPRDEVSKARPSFAHRPVTLGHPDVPVTADNWKEHARGWTGDEVSIEGDVVRVPMLLADAEAIRAVEAGTRQLSMGYDVELEWTPGTSPSGETYDAIQRSIRGNHVALVDAARGGPELTVDGRPSNATSDGMPTADMSVEKAIALPRYAGMWPSQAMQAAIRDLSHVKAAVADAKAAAARDHMISNLSDAWKGAA